MGFVLIKIIHMFGPPGSGKTTFLKQNHFYYNKYSKFQYFIHYLLYSIYYLLNKKEFKCMKNRFILLKHDKFYIKNLIRSLVKQNLQSRKLNCRFFIPDESFYHLLICFAVFTNLDILKLLNFSEINKKNLNVFLLEVDLNLNLDRLKLRERNLSWNNRVTQSDKEIIFKYHQSLKIFLDNAYEVSKHSKNEIINPKN